MTPDAYQQVREEALRALGLPTDPPALLDQHALTLHPALTEGTERAAVGDREVSVDADGRFAR